MCAFRRTRDFPDEICAISCQPYDPSKNYASALAVSFWGSNKVEILALDSKPALQVVCDVVLPALPRSVLLHNFGTGTRPRDPEFHPYLLVGLADGTLVTCALRDGTLHDRKQSSLGNAPASLSVCTIDGRTVVLASGTRSSVLFWDRQRVRPSPVSVKVSRPYWSLDMLRYGEAYEASARIGYDQGCDIAHGGVPVVSGYCDVLSATHWKHLWSGQDANTIGACPSGVFKPASVGL